MLLVGLSSIIAKYAPNNTPNKNKQNIIPKIAFFVKIIFPISKVFKFIISLNYINVIIYFLMNANGKLYE